MNWLWFDGTERIRRYEDFMYCVGISCDFVGHPISSLPTYNENELSSIRNKLNIEDDELLLVVLPGSRVSEIKRLLPIFLKSLGLIVSSNKGPMVSRCLRAATSGTTPP